MSDHVARYEGLIDRFIAWASTRPDLWAAFIVGSRARTNVPADMWSDLDVVLFADDPARLLDDREWLSHLGEPEITFREPTAVGIWEERRVLFADGCDADFSVLPERLIDELERAGNDSLLYQQASNVVARGYRLLVDKDGRLALLFGAMASSPTGGDEMPSQGDLDQTLSDFWYHCVWTARKLRRGEMAVAHECLEGNQRRLLLQLIRWRAHRDGDTWHGTRFFEQWAPDELRTVYAQAFAHHEAADIARALGVMMDLVSSLGTKIADVYGLDVDPRPEAAARRWVAQVLGA